MNKKVFIASMLAVLSLVLITIGVTMAYFSYKQNGETLSTLTSGVIKLHYKEVSGIGAGISISDAHPANNDDAKVSNNYFDFKITGTANSKNQIPYVVTARMSNESDSVLGDIVDIYLTEVNGNSEEATTLFKTDIPAYNALVQYSKVTGYTEKIIYADSVKTGNYEKNFRLRMWIDEEANFSSGRYNDKEFSITVNVNAEGSLAAAIKSCRNINNKYYGISGTEVDIDTYMTECRNEKKLCQISGGTYYGIEGNIIDSETYETECGETCICQFKNNEYIGKDGTTVDKDVYVKDCTTPKNEKNPDEEIIDDLISDNDDDNECVTSGYYGLKCSCDNRWIAWQDGDNYLTAGGRSMDKTRTLDINYPPANTYSCSCGATQGYVVNTGKLFGQICQEENQSGLLNELILANNEVITTSPTLTGPANSTSDASGLYKMSVTNGFGGQDGDTYYFRGNLREENVVEFAEQTWKVIRINEDGTVRLILDYGINNNATSYQYSSPVNQFSSLYYSNSGNYIKKTVNDWYTANITGDNATKVATGNYFCESARVIDRILDNSGGTTMTVNTNYIPDLKCVKDANNKQYVSSSVGLITYDELLLAGEHRDDYNQSSYIFQKSGKNCFNPECTSFGYPENGFDFWTMSPGGMSGSNYAFMWIHQSSSRLWTKNVSQTAAVRPVINLKADTIATKNKTTGHYVVD